jgi:hypothetical protein
MSGETELMTSEQIKAWVMRQTFPPAPWELPMDERILDALRPFGFDRIRLAQVPHHPVFRLTARYGRFVPTGARPLKIIIRKIGKELGFVLSIRDIVVEVDTDRFVAVFALVPQDATPVVVEDDGHRVPDHLEFEEAAA